MAAVEVEREVEMPHAVARHLRLGDRHVPPWGTVEGHADFLAGEEGRWLALALARLPMSPWEEAALAC